MNAWQLAVRGLLHHVRMHAAVLLGVAAGAAVLTGALIVGDSVRGSLRALTIERLGAIDQALVVDRFFRAELAAELAKTKPFQENFAAAIPGILLRATLENPASGRRAGAVNVVGADKRFTAAGDGGPTWPLAAGEIVLNETLADELGVNPGEEVLLRLPTAADVPPDSPWGRKTETIRSRRLKVRDVIAARGLGEFTLGPSQRSTLVAYLSLGTLQSALDLRGQVNAIFVAGHDPQQPAAGEVDEALAKALAPRLADYGLHVAGTTRGDVQLTTDRMLLAPAVEKAALASWGALEPRPVFTYLANTIAVGDREIPYSTVTAADFDGAASWGPLVDLDGQPIGALAADEIVLNEWAAADLGDPEPGEIVRLDYFEPESTHGAVREASHEFRLKGICKIEGIADDPSLTPEVRGVTDQESIADWDPPFPFDADRIRDQDEAYWDEHRGTPKAFVALPTGRKLWGSRFGQTTSIVVPQENVAGEAASDEAIEVTVAELSRLLRFEPAALGFVMQPVKRQGLQASAGTTPFEYLFLGFSFFLIAAAVMLVALLFRLGLEQRAGEVGIMSAVGLRPGIVRRVFAGEATGVALAGGLLGALLGVGYAWLMLAALRTWWIAAVNTTRLELHVPSLSLAIGALAGTLVALAAIAWTLRSARRVSVRRLLAGQMNDERPARGVSPATIALAGIALIGGLGLAGAGARMNPQQQAGAFFAAGALVLTALLAATYAWLSSGARGAMVAAGAAALPRLSARNAARHAGRSTLTVGLVAAATFLIVALSAFRLDTADSYTTTGPVRDDGAGGFSLVAESDQPILVDLNDSAARGDLGFDARHDDALADVTTFALRVRPGDDASCLNLYQPRQPRIVGVPEALIARGGFDWAQTAPGNESERANPWLLLKRELPADAQGRPRVPVVIDLNTAMYSLHLYRGVGATLEIDDGRGNKHTLEVVGLLQNSILQGDLLIDEAAFRATFPDQAGFRAFLIDAPPARAAEVSQALEKSLSDYGFDVHATRDRLASFAAVQNTYLSTFQSLGGLGLLLGTFGLATVQLRNVLERRKELALLRAVGLRDRLVAELVLWENVWLLLAGLIIGLLSALIVVAPLGTSRDLGVPWMSLGVTLLAVVAAGILASLAAVRAAVGGSLSGALRGE